MPPRLPKTLQIGAKRYTVHCDRARITNIGAEQNSNLAGFSDHRWLTIDIDPNQALEEKQDTLLHETLHAIVNITNVNADLNREQEEALVARLTPVLLDVLRRNPRLVAYLTEEA